MMVRIWEHLNVLRKEMTIKILFLLLFYLFAFSSKAQPDYPDEVHLLFYNVENLFDTRNDPLTEDDDLTPAGDKHWTSKRLNAKLLNISKVILNASGWASPDIIALAEIENRWVTEQLLTDTPLKNSSYKIIHKESPDHRGLDVVLLYNETHFYPLEYRYYPLLSNSNQVERTREILYVSGILNETDTLHIFVNHWPSRYSGLLESKPMRMAAAKLLKSKTDELFQKYNSPKIVVVGDFNDNPTDESIKDILQASTVTENVNAKHLYNLAANWHKSSIGTLKYQSEWDVFDQIIVSGALINAESGYTTSENDATIVQFPFLLEVDERYTGYQPFRTYNGFTYLGGFSDHLPVLLKMEIIN